ncbi:MAG: glycosyl hydrolase, partial [Rhodothermales bacterium]|nr:glycosyl hydrolase [Rhodothermales bacterium]
DVHDVTGAYPAVYGWELGDLENGVAANLDTVNFKEMQGWIREGYRRGGIITISWHMDNPQSGGSAWDTTRAVHTIVPGGRNHDLYLTWLDRFVEFVGGLKTGSFSWLGIGKPVPIIFRPFHEHTGSWFWWGKDNVTPEEYVRLWRFTIEYLRDKKGLHNLIYAYSTDVFDTEEEYLEHYPGDDYVDILGYDDYHSLRSDETVSEMTERLRKLVLLAEARGKIAALTETGSEGVRDPHWWTNRLLRAVESDPIARRIAWALVWRNANFKHHYAPYAGHPSASDFVAFYQSPFVLFGDKLPDLYR